jgi:hypothetical protein
MKHKHLLFAGRALDVSGRTLIPIITRHILRFDNSWTVFGEPIGIYVMENGTEWYYPLKDQIKIGDFSEITGLADILREKRST